MKAIDYEEESTKRGNWLDITGGAAKDSLTVLDHFAAAFLTNKWCAHTTAEETAQKAFAVAEAMLAERNKRYTPQNVVKGVTGKTYG